MRNIRATSTLLLLRIRSARALATPPRKILLTRFYAQRREMEVSTRSAAPGMVSEPQQRHTFTTFRSQLNSIVCIRVTL